MSMIRRSIRRIRDQPAILAACVWLLRGARAVGSLRSKRFYSHVPFVGIVNVASGSGTFRIRSRGNLIENALYWDGLFGHEPETMRIWVEAAVSSKGVLDIGANSGVFALSASAAGAKSVHAFEPLPRVHSILVENLELNSFPGSHAWPFAVGEKSGVATIFDPGGDAPTSASLSQGFVKENFGNVPGADVMVVSIDEFCQSKCVADVDLIKIDVEGYEKYALRGMRETVAVHSPTILMEVLEGQEAELRAEVESLWPEQYIWKPIDEGKGHVSRNVLLQPREKMVEIGYR